jgi:hypothetical protein
MRKVHMGLFLVYLYQLSACLCREYRVDFIIDQLDLEGPCSRNVYLFSMEMMAHCYPTLVYSLWMLMYIFSRGQLFLIELLFILTAYIWETKPERWGWLTCTWHLGYVVRHANASASGKTRQYGQPPPRETVQPSHPKIGGHQISIAGWLSSNRTRFS